MVKTKIFLFGKTGSGKSTIGNMLIAGTLDPDKAPFRVSSGLRGETSVASRSENEEFVVVDTVGHGEGDKGTVSNADAEKYTKELLKITKEGFHFFAYVKSEGRMDEVDKQILNFFKEVFTGAEQNFIVIFTKSTPKWVEDNKDELMKDFDFGSDRFYAVSFPWINSSEMLEKQFAKKRTASLERLVRVLRPPRLPDLLCPARSLYDWKRSILVVGRKSKAKDMLINLLTQSSMDSPHLSSRVACPPDGLISDGSLLENSGKRGWEILDAVSFEGNILSSPCSARFIKYDEQNDTHKAAALLATKAIRALSYGSFHRFLFVIEAGNWTKEDKLIWEVLRHILDDSKSCLLVVIIEMGDRHWSEADVRKESKEYHVCNSMNVLLLRFPNMSEDEDREKENSNIRVNSLRFLETFLSPMCRYTTSPDEKTQQILHAKSKDDQQILQRVREDVLEPKEKKEKKKLQDITSSVTVTIKEENLGSFEGDNFVPKGADIFTRYVASPFEKLVNILVDSFLYLEPDGVANGSIDKDDEYGYFSPEPLGSDIVYAHHLAREARWPNMSINARHPPLTDYILDQYETKFYQWSFSKSTGEGRFVIPK